LVKRSALRSNFWNKKKVFRSGKSRDNPILEAGYNKEHLLLTIQKPTLCIFTRPQTGNSLHMLDVGRPHVREEEAFRGYIFASFISQEAYEGLKYRKPNN